jgi:hypothetical protein
VRVPVHSWVHLGVLAYSAVTHPSTPKHTQLHPSSPKCTWTYSSTPMHQNQEMLTPIRRYQQWMSKNIYYGMVLYCDISYCCWFSLNFPCENFQSGHVIEHAEVWYVNKTQVRISKLTLPRKMREGIFQS